MSSSSERFYVLKVAPGREKVVVRNIERFYLCGGKRESVELPVKKRKIRIKKSQMTEEQLIKYEETRKPIYKVIVDTVLDTFDFSKDKDVGTVCLVNDVIMPDLKGYVVIDADDREKARVIARKERYVWRVLEGTVPRDEIELNIKRIERSSDIFVGDFVVPSSGPFEGIKSRVLGFTPDGRLKLATTGQNINLKYTPGKDNVGKEHIGENVE